MDRTDEVLVRLIARGDSEALGELYGRHATALNALGRRLRLSAEEREDVVHDVFIEVWKFAHKYDASRGTVLTWLAVRMRSRCLDRIRRRVRNSEVLNAHEEAFWPRAPTPPGVESVERSRLRVAVGELSPDLRDVMKHAYFRGSTTSEIADELAIPQGTVKSRLIRARSLLLVTLSD